MRHEELIRRTLNLGDWRAPRSTVEYRTESARHVRAGFVGCGGHAYRNLLTAFHFAPVDLVALADIAGERAEAIRREFGAERAYTDYRAMLAREQIDCVVVVTNYDDDGRPRFPGIAIDALDAGCNAWIEKPPAHRLDEVEAMRAAERRTGHFIQVGYKKMFVPAYVKARELSQTPQFGGARQLLVRYPQRMPHPAGRFDLKGHPGALPFLDHVWHPFAITQLLMGDVREMTYLWEADTGGWIATFAFAAGGIGVLNAAGGQARGAPIEHVELFGDGEHIIVENNTGLTYLRRYSGHHYGRDADHFTPIDQAPIVWDPEFSPGVLYNKNASSSAMRRRSASSAEMSSTGRPRRGRTCVRPI